MSSTLQVSQPEKGRLEEKIEEILLLDPEREKYEVNKNIREYFEVLNNGLDLEKTLQRLDEGEVEGVNKFVVSAIREVIEDKELKTQLEEVYNQFKVIEEDGIPLKYNLGNAFLYSIITLGNILQGLKEEDKKEFIRWLRSSDEEKEKFTRFQKFLLAGAARLLKDLPALGNPIMSNAVSATTNQDDHIAKTIGRHSRSKLPGPAVLVETEVNAMKQGKGSKLEKNKIAVQGFVEKSFNEIFGQVKSVNSELVRSQVMKGLFEVFYGHRSLADLANITLFFENVSMDEAMLLIGHALANGSEASTRYIEFIHNKEIIRRRIGIKRKEGITLTKEEEDALRTVEEAISVMGQYVKDVGENWDSFLERVKDVFREKVMPFGLFDKIEANRRGENWTTKEEYKKRNIYEGTITKYAFDIIRGFLPVGTLTRLAVQQSARTWYSTLKSLIGHWIVSQDKEIEELIKNISAALRISVPSFERDKTLEEEFKSVFEKAKEVERRLNEGEAQSLEEEISKVFPRIAEECVREDIGDYVELMPANFEEILIPNRFLVGEEGRIKELRGQGQKLVPLELTDGVDKVHYYQAVLQRIYRLKGHGLKSAQEKALERIIAVVGDNYSRELSNEQEKRLIDLIQRELEVEGNSLRLLKDEKISRILPLLRGGVLRYLISIGAFRDFNRHRSHERLPGGGYSVVGGTVILKDLTLTMNPIIKGGTLYYENPETGKVVKEEGYEGIKEIKEFVERWQDKIFEVYEKVLKVWPTIMKLSKEGKVENRFEPHYLLPFFTPIIAYMSANDEKIQYFLTLRTTSEGNPEYVRLALESAIKYARRNPVYRGEFMTNFGMNPEEFEERVREVAGEDWKSLLLFVPYLPSLTGRLPRAGEVGRETEAKEN